MSTKHIPIYALSVVVSLSLLLSACGAATPTATTAPAATSAPAATTAPGAPTTAATGMQVPSLSDGYAGPALNTKDKIVLTILRFTIQPADTALLNQMEAEFTAAHPNITFQTQEVPYGNLYQTVQTDAAAGNLPDMWWSDGPLIKNYAYYGLNLPIDPYVTPAYLADILPSTRAENSYQGKLYGFPWGTSALVSYFNKDYFAAAGLATPAETMDMTAGWTWDQYLAALQKLTITPTGSNSPTQWGLAASEYGAGGPGGHYYYEGIFIRSRGDPNAPAGSSLYNTWAGQTADGTSVEGYIDTPEAIAGMTYYQSLFQKYKVTPLVGIPSQFQDGKAAVMWGDDSYYGRTTAQAPNIKFGVSPIPKGQIVFTHIGTDEWQVSAKTKYPAEAMAFLVYLHDYNNGVRRFNESKALPGQLSVFKNFQSIYSTPPLGVYYSELTTPGVAAPRPPGPGWSIYLTIMNSAVKDIALGADPATRLKQAASDLDAQLVQFPSK